MDAIIAVSHPNLPVIWQVVKMERLFVTSQESVERLLVSNDKIKFEDCHDDDNDN